MMRLYEQGSVYIHMQLDHQINFESERLDDA